MAGTVKDKKSPSDFEKKDKAKEKTLGFAQIQRKDRKFKALPKIPKLKPDSESKENHKPQNHVRGKNQSGPHNNAKNHNSQHYNKGNHNQTGYKNRKRKRNRNRFQQSNTQDSDKHESKITPGRQATGKRFFQKPGKSDNITVSKTQLQELVEQALQQREKAKKEEGTTAKYVPTVKSRLGNPTPLEKLLAEVEKDADDKYGKSPFKDKEIFSQETSDESEAEVPVKRRRNQHRVPAILDFSESSISGDEEADEEQEWKEADVTRCPSMKKYLYSGTFTLPKSKDEQVTLATLIKTKRCLMPGLIEKWQTRSKKITKENRRQVLQDRQTRKNLYRLFELQPQVGFDRSDLLDLVVKQTKKEDLPPFDPEEESDDEDFSEVHTPAEEEQTSSVEEASDESGGQSGISGHADDAGYSSSFLQDEDATKTDKTSTPRRHVVSQQHPKGACQALDASGSEEATSDRLVIDESAASDSTTPALFGPPTKGNDTASSAMIEEILDPTSNRIQELARELTNKGDEIKSRKRKTVNQLNLIESELNKWRRDRDKFAEVADKVGVTVKKSPKPVSWKIPPRIEIPLERQISPGYKTKRFLPVNADYSTSKSAD